MDSQVADVLEAAAEVIEERGWCQNELVTHDGRVCLMGAVDTAARRLWSQGVGRNLFTPAWKVVADRITREGMFPWPYPVGWNDEDGRSEFEVVDLLRHCAKDVRNGEAG